MCNIRKVIAHYINALSDKSNMMDSLCLILRSTSQKYTSHLTAVDMWLLFEQVLHL